MLWGKYVEVYICGCICVSSNQSTLLSAMDKSTNTNVITLGKWHKKEHEETLKTDKQFQMRRQTENISNINGVRGKFSFQIGLRQIRGRRSGEEHLSARPEVLSTISSNHVGAHNHLQWILILSFSVPEDRALIVIKKYTWRNKPFKKKESLARRAAAW